MQGKLLKTLKEDTESLKLLDFFGAEGSLASYLLSSLHQEGDRLAVVVAPTPESSRRFSTRLSFTQNWFANRASLLFFPALEWSPYGDISPERRLIVGRLQGLFRLQEKPGPAMLVLPAEALLRKVVPQKFVSESSELLQKEEEIDRDRFAKALVAAGYQNVPLVEDRGTFHLRGGIIDVFSPLAPYPARVELYGDLIESIRFFDPKNQRTLQEIDELTIGPAREECFTKEGIRRAKKVLRNAADAVNLPSSKTRMLLEQIERGVPFFGGEAFAPAYHEPWDSFFDYLGENIEFFLEDPVQVRRALQSAEQREEDAFLTRRSRGEVCLSYDAYYLSANEVIEKICQNPLRRFQRVAIDTNTSSEARFWDEAGLPSEEDGPHQENQIVQESIGKTAEKSFTLPGRSNADLAREIEKIRVLRGEDILGPLARRIRFLGEEGCAIGLVTSSFVGAERLAALVRSAGVAATVRKEPKPTLQPNEGWPLGPLLPLEEERAEISVLVGPLDQGFVLPGVLALITEEEIFGPKARRRVSQKKVQDPFSTSIADLEVGDLIVHVDHGIGRYQGLVKLVIQGREGDFLLIEYAEKNKLYLPVYRLGRVQKYIGAEHSQIKVDKLGGTAWEKAKRKVSKAVREMAEELLRLYAERQVRSAKAFPAPDRTLQAFEASFGFTETPDQQSAIDAVLDDLQKPNPMDRLVCGDVGYGKTEVALRAAFYAAMNGGQVAVLVPTTVLAQQHYLSFSSRIKHWPLRVEVLSRFVSRKEQRTILEDLKAGKVDILIGTHRLLSQDVKFRDLQVLVVDEEQRFGVVHKERLKKLKTQVHVLTLTATPIPRTLNMAMMGVRDLSIIATAPVDRLAVRTFVSRTTDDVIQKSIRQELARGGQVFFVHNRVQTIGKIEEHLQKLVPEARICVGHGQMTEGALERVMIEFVRGAYDILLCTTIIESGLDIARANTILINRADMFGLAQLYQLRGRVGRSTKRAYCYLLIPGESNMTDDAKQRLATLQRFTELGAGFQVASQDLEIRGAGDLLGDSQSGQVSTVGFELYTELLAEAIAALKGEEPKTQVDPEINVDVNALIPENFVDDVHERLRLYRRLNKVEDSIELEEISSEMIDRFGPLPKEVENLLQVMELQKILRRMNALRIDLQGSRLSVGLGESPNLSPDKVLALIKEANTPYKLSPDFRLSQRLTLSKSANDTERLAAAQQALETFWSRAAI